MKRQKRTTKADELLRTLDAGAPMTAKLAREALKEAHALGVQDGAVLLAERLRKAVQKL